MTKMSSTNSGRNIAARAATDKADVLVGSQETESSAGWPYDQIMTDLANQGAAIIMISSELPEVLGMSDRVMVMRDGRIVKELARADASEEVVMHYAVGHEEVAS